MTTSTSWPINKFGTSWRRGLLFFFWPDEAVVEEAIETLNPLHLTVWSEAVAIGSPRGNGKVSLDLLLDMHDDDDDCAVIHPCEFPALFTHQFAGIENGEGWFHVIGIAHLDLADEATYIGLRDALAVRSQRFTFELPLIRF